MEHFILNFLSHNTHFLKDFGSYIIFVLSSLESVPFVGMIIPGQTLLMVAGFASKLKILTLPQIIIGGSLGAIFGDICCFIIAKKYKEGVVIFLKKYVAGEIIYKTNDAISSYPAFSIIFGRFNGLTRSIAPFIAGISDIKTKTFCLYSVVGGTLWGTFFVITGYVAGKSIALIGSAIATFMFVVTLIIILIFILYKEAKRKNIPIKSYDSLLVALTIISGYALTVFGKIGETREAVRIFDAKIFFETLHTGTPIISKILLPLSLISPMQFGIIATLVAVILIIHKRKKDLILFISTISIGALGLVFIKEYAGQVRPIVDPSLFAEGGSFPSGHTALATIFLGLIWYFVKNRIKKGYATTLGFGIWITIALTGISRVYLRVHWLSDIFGGIAYGILILSVAVLIRRSFDRKNHKEN